MKKVLLILFVIYLPCMGMAQVWQERFNGLPNGSTSYTGATSWTTVTPAGGIAGFSKQTPVAGYELFLIDNTVTEGVWQSETISISALEKVAIEITLYSNFTYASDYMRCYYILDGGTEIKFGELQGNNGLNITSAASAIVSGQTLQIVIRGMDNTLGKTNNIINGMAFDDVTITSISVLYANSSGNWDNSNTWSTIGSNGISCGCIPNSNTEVVIGNGYNISVPSAAIAAGVTIQGGGKLQFTSNTSLTLARGGILKIDEGGELNNSSGKGNIIYGAYTYSVIVNGNLSLGTFTANAGSSISFTGNGAITVENFLISSGNGKTITLNTSGGFNIITDLNFQAASSNVTVINQRNLVVGNRILFSSSSTSLINNASIATGSILVSASTNNGNVLTNAASGTLNTGAINLNNGDFTLNNSGIINQTGNFLNVDAGTMFKNMNGSIWNFSGGGTNTRLFCNYGSNTFNYSSAGAQNVLIPADAYANLMLSGSGLKTLSGNVDVNGDLTTGNTVQVDISASLFTISLGGNWNMLSSHTNPFIERTGTIILDGTTDQTISTVLGRETFYNLNINKISGNAIQSSATPTDIVVSNNLNLIDGGLSINGRTLSVTNSSNTAIARTSGYILSETTVAPYSYLKWFVGTSTGPYIFPFGKTRSSGDYIPFTFNITSPGTGAGSVAVTTYATGINNLPLPTGVLNLNTLLNTLTNTDNSAKIADRFWYITLDNYITNPTTTVTFVATNAETGSINAPKAQRWNAITGAWDLPRTGQVSTINSATVSGVTTFSPWIMAESNTALPIELLFFKVMVRSDVVNIEWQSAQELNNDYYTLQKSTDLETYQDIAKLTGAGTSTKKITYRTIDNYPYAGKSYYRLKQTDFNGHSTYFKPVAIQFTGRVDATLSVYPVPSKAQELTLEFKGLQPYEDCPLNVMDLRGEIVFSTTLKANEAGEFAEKILLHRPLPAGLYIIKAGRLLSSTRKILIE